MKETQTTKTIIGNQLTGGTGGVGNINFGYPFNFIPVIPFKLPYGDFGSPRSRKVKAIAKYGYTPDYTSIITGRSGKATKGAFGGRYSGMEVRPVNGNWLRSLGMTRMSLFGKKRSKKKR